MSDSTRSLQDRESTAFVDAFFETYAEAMREAQHRKMTLGDPIITRIEESPYGGYRVWSMPADVYIDLISENLPTSHPIKFGKVPA
jgi:hypothetical protein